MFWLVLAVLVVVGAVASAGPGPHSTRPGDHRQAPGHEADADEADADEADADEADADGRTGEQEGSGGADLSACEGETALDNAGCRVEANASDHPNPGLSTALARIRAVQEARASREPDEDAASGGGPRGQGNGPPR